jgi:hypothetical protein
VACCSCQLRPHHSLQVPTGVFETMTGYTPHAAYFVHTAAQTGLVMVATTDGTMMVPVIADPQQQPAPLVFCKRNHSFQVTTRICTRCDVCSEIGTP